MLLGIAAVAKGPCTDYFGPVDSSGFTTVVDPDITAGLMSTQFETFIHHSGPSSKCLSPGPPSGCHRYYVVHYSGCNSSCPLTDGSAASLAGNRDTGGVFDRGNGMLKSCGACAKEVQVKCYGAPADAPVKCPCPGSDPPRTLSNAAPATSASANSCPAGQQRCRDFPCGAACKCDGPPGGFGMCVPNDAIPPSTMTAVVATAAVKDPTTNLSTVEIDRSHPVPSPGRGEVLIAAKASSVNPVDWKILEAGDLSTLLSFPHTLGFDVAGTVAAVGKGCARLSVGDEVWADLGKDWVLKGRGELGAYAQYALADESQVGLKPSGMSFGDAASLPLVALTTLQSYQKMGLTDGSRGKNLTVVVTSGSGGTGLAGVQMARAYGATKVITACGPTSQAYCRSLGADVVTDYTKGKKSLWDAAGTDAVDAVYDNFGAPGTADLAMPSLKAGGVFLFLPGKNAAVSKHPKPGVTQINFGLCDSTRFADLDALRALSDAGYLSAHVSQSFALEDVPKAFAASIAGGVVGKLGVQIA
jgi:NADPH2:quinone reductase